ncbi:MAG: aconitase X, partial [Zestosphaera sp.]
LSVINYVKSKGSGGLEGRELWLGVSEDLQLDKGLLDSLASLGVRLIRGMCPVTTKLNMLGVRYVVTDSGKALHYMPKLAGVKVIIKDRPEILKEFLRR